MTSDRQPDKLISQSELESGLRAALPDQLRTYAGDLADTIITAIRNEGAVNVTTGPLAATLEALRGRNIPLAESILTFGEGNQLGDVRIGDVAGRDLFHITLMSGMIGGDGEERSYRQTVLEAMERLWGEDKLRDSLTDGKIIDLSLSYDESAIQSPSWAESRGSERAASSCSLSNIAAIFDNEERQILILGEQGAGKTTLLHNLAIHLISNAKLRDDAPVPIVFQLASWQYNRSLNEWMREQLAKKYDVPTAIGRSWLEGRRIIPLLDGLDEVTANNRANCVKAINEFRLSLGTPGLVVACRSEDYAIIGLKLQLRTAICIEPLSFEHIDGYLAQGGPTVEKLRASLAEDRELQEMAKTPLTLNQLIEALSRDSADHPERVIEQPNRQRLPKGFARLHLHLQAHFFSWPMLKVEPEGVPGGILTKHSPLVIEAPVGWVSLSFAKQRTVTHDSRTFLERMGENRGRIFDSTKVSHTHYWDTLSTQRIALGQGDNHYRVRIVWSKIVLEPFVPA